jgi:hypothetical protein
MFFPSGQGIRVERMTTGTATARPARAGQGATLPILAKTNRRPTSPARLLRSPKTAGTILARYLTSRRNITP